MRAVLLPSSPFVTTTAPRAHFRVAVRGLLTESHNNDKVVVVIPDFDADGVLPPGIHEASSWDEITARFGWTAYRQDLLAGLADVLTDLRVAGCKLV